MCEDVKVIAYITKEMCVAALLSVYVLWLGFELQVYGARTAVEIGLFPGGADDYMMVAFGHSEPCFLSHIAVSLHTIFLCLWKSTTYN